MGDEATGVIYGLSCACHPEARTRYIGQTRVGMLRRLSRHLTDARSGSERPVCRWIRKHGTENIRAMEIEAPLVSMLDDREIYWIASFRQRGYGLLNANDGGSGRGAHVSVETRARLGRARLGHLVSIETRRKLSLANRGRVISDLQRQHMREAALRRAPRSAATNEKMRQILTGHVVSLETRRRISEAQIGKVRDPEEVARQSATRIRNKVALGERNPNVKLTEAAVCEIRSRPNEKSSALAEEFHVSVDTIRRIRRGELWRGVGVIAA